MRFEDVKIGMMVVITDKSGRAVRENLVGLRAKVTDIIDNHHRRGKDQVSLQIVSARKGVLPFGSDIAYYENPDQRDLTLWVQGVEPHIQTNEEALCLLKKI